MMPDPVILNIISKGLQTNFKDCTPCNSPLEHKHSQKDSDIISLLQKNVITRYDISEGGYFSLLSVYPKKDGSFRTILNLKYLNKECFTYCFKMEIIKQVIYVITLNCYVASSDMQDAFYTVFIYEQHKIYLKFLNIGIPYQVEVTPNGYLDAMRVFTKILKPPFFYLWEQGHSSVIHIDDSLLAEDTYSISVNNCSIMLLTDIKHILYFVL